DVAGVVDDIDIVAEAAGQLVDAALAVEQVVLGIAGDGVGEPVADAGDRRADKDQVLEIVAEREVGVAGDEIDAAGRRGVRLRHAVAGAGALAVAAVAPLQIVAAGAAGERVVAGAADQCVVAAVAGELVGAGIADQLVVGLAAGREQGAGSEQLRVLDAGEGGESEVDGERRLDAVAVVVAGLADRVLGVVEDVDIEAGTAVQRVGAGAADERVVAVAAGQTVGAAAAGDAVGGVVAGEDNRLAGRERVVLDPGDQPD